LLNVDVKRQLVDRTALKIALSPTFMPGDFTINSQGGCLLDPQLAKALAGHVAQNVLTEWAYFSCIPH